MQETEECTSKEVEVRKKKIELYLVEIGKAIKRPCINIHHKDIQGIIRNYECPL